MRYRLNTADVVQETIDDEVIIVHLVSGTYFNLGGSGAAAWSALLQGATVEQIIDALSPSAQVPRAEVAADVGHFVDGLLREALLVADGAPAATAADLLATVALPATYAPPMLQAYTDMQELLLIDPIHEVHPDAGWPAPRPANA